MQINAKHLKTSIMYMLCLLMAGIAYGQVPTNNPYADKYGLSDNWTNSLKWENTVNVTAETGVVDTNGKVDSVNLHNLMKSVSEKGGGVVFFPEGSYQLDFTLSLFSGVILRGANPTGVVDGTEEGYNPPSKLVFPRYKKGDSSTEIPNHLAFKRIYGDTTGLENVGLVNLNIDRAVIALYGGNYLTKYTQEGKTFLPNTQHKNVLIYGIRQNNAALPSPLVPSKTHRDMGNGWQRWPWNEGANIDVSVSENCVIANCRLNDNVTDDFEQPNYMTTDNDKYTGEEAMFKFADHSGIAVNANKISYKMSKGMLVVSKNHRFLPSRKKNIEPTLHVKGVVVRDNFVCTSQRYDNIMAFGEDIVLENNVQCDKYQEQNVIAKNGLMSLRWIPFALSEEPFEKRYFVDRANDTLLYRFMKPKVVNAQEKYPLVIHFAGNRARGGDNVRQLRTFITVLAKEENRTKYPTYVLVPQEPVDESWGVDLQEDSVSRPLQATIDLVKKTVEENENIDPSRLYVTGFSDDGGYAAWEILFRAPELNFAAAVPMNAMFDMKKRHLQKICQSTIWVALGDIDVVRGAPYIKLLKDALKKGKCEYKLTTYNELGVNSPEGLIRDPEFLPWLFDQKKEIKQ